MKNHIEFLIAESLELASEILSSLSSRFATLSLRLSVESQKRWNKIAPSAK